MVPQVGQRVGPYEILGKLGTGGMGIVYSAWDARLHRDVAIKILREEYVTPDMRSRFLQEARAASGLNHPNICTIFDIGEQDGDPYLVMELLKGESLRQRMNAVDAPARDIVRIGHDIADALSVAHGRNIIHRDIKPANIFVVDKPGGGFMCKVLDFGLAKIEALNDTTIFDLTHTGTTVGTVSYMSPEQARGEALDTRSDLFSLGVILYEMACGRTPFQGATSALVFVELLSKAPEPIRPQNMHVPPELESVILKLLEKDRTLRYQTAAQVMEALAQIPAGGLAAPAAAAAQSVPAAPRDTTVRSSPASPPSASFPTQRSGSMPAQRRVIVPQPGGTSSAMHSVARPPLENELKPRGEETTAMGTVNADEVIRPRKRIVPSDSSAVQKAAQGLPLTGPFAERPTDESQTRIVAEPAQPAYDETVEGFAAPSRPIVPQSARPLHETKPNISLPRVAAQRPTPRFAPVDSADDEDARPSREKPAGDKPSWMLPAIAAAVLAAGGLAWWLWPHSGGGALSGGSGKVIPILLAPVASSSGDTVLAGAVAAGLSFDLSQSPQFLVEDPSAMDAGLKLAGLPPDASGPDAARKAAQAIGATEVLFAELKANGSAYTVAIHVNAADTGAEAFHSEQTAQSREQIPDALDRLLIDMRTTRGESSDGVSRASVPLSKEATGNLEALEDYAVGLSLMNKGQLAAAAAQFEHAVGVDAHFTQAYLRLADIERSQHAMVSAGASAVNAQSSATNASQRTQNFAAASVALNATDDAVGVAAIAQQLLAAYPNSVRARVDASTALMEQGKYAESFDMVDGALRREPYNLNASAISEIDMIAQGRAAAARSTEETAAKAGRGHAALKLLIDYLVNGESGGVDPSAGANGNVALGEMQAALLDATGQERAGLQQWHAVAAEAGTQQTLFSAAADALSQAALDRALTGDCADGGTLVGQAGNYPLGIQARLRTGIAAALCGDTGTARSNLDMLTHSYPNSFAVKAYGAAELSAVIAWKGGNAQGALNELQGARQYDNVSLAPLLRGLIHLHSGLAQEAELDFQYLVQHPGPASLVSPMLYPMAELGLARAYAASGDRLNAGIWYSKFLGTWSAADAGSPLVAEAHANAH